MSRDRKLREVLDTLSGDPARSLPSQDRELMESVLRRLRIQESQRPVPPQEQPPEPEPSELDEAREEALRNQQALQELRARQEHDAEEMTRLQDERERLLAHQEELEERLARLEAASHGGPLSYVEENPEPETVEFSRVDLNNHQNNQEELLEFQYIGSEQGTFERPEAGAWEPDEAESPDWNDSDWPEADQEQAQEQAPPKETGVRWDEENIGDEPAWETAAADEEPWPASPAEDPPGEPQAAEPWQEPDEPGWEDADHQAEETPAWSEPTVEESWAEHEDAPPSAPQEQAPGTPDEGLEELDERTRAELEELEAQLADLEREIEKRDQKKQALGDDENNRD